MGFFKKDTVDELKKKWLMKVSKYPLKIEKIPDVLKVQEFYTEIFHSYNVMHIYAASVLRNVPEKFKTVDLCIAAVEQAKKDDAVLGSYNPEEKGKRITEVMAFVPADIKDEIKTLAFGEKQKEKSSSPDVFGMLGKAAKVGLEIASGMAEAEANAPMHTWQCQYCSQVIQSKHRPPPARCPAWRLQGSNSGPSAIHAWVRVD